jgi:hypothetical protein
MRQFAVILMLSLWPWAVWSAEITGQDDPRFTTALDQWLADTEVEALPSLAALAREGNPAARVLLGLIDKYSWLQGPWLALLPKSERTALLRDAGGLSGTSWLRQTPQAPVAGVLLDVLDSQADIETALSLADYDEPGRVRAALISLEARQITGFSAFAEDPRFPPETRYLIWRDWVDSDAHLDALNREFAALAPGDPQREMLTGPVRAPLLESWFAATDSGGPLRTLCAAQCPDNPPACMGAGYQALGGYRRFITLGSPLTALISEARFAASPRGQAAVLRRAMSFAFLTRERINQIGETDACFGALLAAEGQKF